MAWHDCVITVSRSELCVIADYWTLEQFFRRAPAALLQRDYGLYAAYDMIAWVLNSMAEMELAGRLTYEDGCVKMLIGGQENKID